MRPAAGDTTGGKALLRFGRFEVDLRRQELRREGVRLRLQPQPFKLLVLLALRPGELVTREELQRELWGGDTFVDFGQGLGFCVRQVRCALGDDARAPVYLQTLPRRGYRFLAPVEHLAEPAPPRPRWLAAAVLAARRFFARRPKVL